jgi:hypothetical protein
MTDEPTTAQAVIATILDCCRAPSAVEMLRDMALRSGRYTVEEQGLIVQAADTRLVMLRGR